MKKCFVCHRKPSPDQHISFHKFPSAADLRQKWKNACFLMDLDDVANIYICSTHFSSADVRTVQGKGEKRRIALLPQAIPNLSLNDTKKQAERRPNDAAVASNLEELAEQEMAVEVKKEPEEEFDESFWANPHFSSLKGYFEERESLTKICRICLQAVVDNQWQILTSDEENFQIDIRKKVKFILPNINLDVFSNSVVCNKCLELVNYSIELQEKWLLSQVRLNEVIDKTRTEKTKVHDIVIEVEPPIVEIKEEPGVYQIDASRSSSINELISSHQNVSNENPLLLHEADTQLLLNRNITSGLEHSVANSNKQEQHKKISEKQRQCKKINYIPNIICSVCQEVFTSIAKYTIHTPQHIQTKNTCFRCKKIFQHINVLFSHLKECLKIK